MSPESKSRLLKSGDFTHLFVMAFGGAFVAMLFLGLLFGNPANNFLSLSSSILVSIPCGSLFVAAAWSVLGMGSYLARVFWSHSALLLVGLGYLVGFLLFSDSYFQTDLLRVFIVVILMIPSLSLAAQLPLWCFRFAFGWQFAFHESDVAKAFTLRDIFVFTFCCALGLATLQFAAERLAYWSGPGEWSSTLGFSVLCVCGISVLCIPVLPIVFWSKESAAACASMVMYAFSWVFVLLVIVAVLSSTLPPAEVLGGILALFGSFAAVISFPFMVSKGNGFRLTSTRRDRKGDQSQ